MNIHRRCNMKKKWLSLVLMVTLVMTMIVPATSVSFAGEEPSITITSALLNNQSNYRVGDSGALRYTITPAGGVQEVNRPPVDTVLVLDVSNSMNGNKLATLKSSAKAFVKHMKDNGVNGDKITLMYFHTRTTKVGTYHYSAFSGLDAAIDNLFASRSTSTGYSSTDGGTNYEDALFTAKSYFSSYSTSNSVLFFSDGVPTFYNKNNNSLGGTGYEDPRYNSELEKSKTEAIAEASALKSKAAIYTISLGTNQSQHNVMNSIATDSSSALISPGTSELTAAFKKIAEKVTSKEITNIKIRGTKPTGLTINAASLPQGYTLTWITSDTYEITVPNVTFPADGTTPSPISFNVPFTANTEGTRTLGSGGATFTNTKNVQGSHNITGVQVNIFQVSPPVITPSTTEPTNQNVTATISYPGTTTAKYYKVVGKGVDPNSVTYTSLSNATTKVITVENNETTIYAYSVNGNYQSPVTAYLVNNIDKVPPATPVISEGTPAIDGTSMSVDVSISYSTDSTIKEYRIGTSGSWTAYTGSIPVNVNGTIIQARGKDAAGNYSEIASHTVNHLISMVENSSVVSVTNTNRVSAVQNGSFISVVKFRTSQTLTNQVQLSLNMDKNSSLFSKMVLPTTIKATSTEGNTVNFSVAKDSTNGKLIFTSVTPVSAGTKNFTMKVLVKVNKANVSTYNMQIEGSTAPALLVDVVKNPPIK